MNTPTPEQEALDLPPLGLPVLRQLRRFSEKGRHVGAHAKLRT